LEKLAQYPEIAQEEYWVWMYYAGKEEYFLRFS
jgi:hypothetical protein